MFLTHLVEKGLLVALRATYPDLVIFKDKIEFRIGSRRRIGSTG